MKDQPLNITISIDFAQHIYNALTISSAIAKDASLQKLKDELEIKYKLINLINQ